MKAPLSSGIHGLGADPHPGAQHGATARSQIAGGQMTTSTRLGHLGRGRRDVAGQGLAAACVGGFIFQLPATSGVAAIGHR